MPVTLNPQQHQIVTHHLGPALVIAGAGSGKTRCLIQRIEHLIEVHHALPGQILCVTFTNKAAREMRERAQLLLGEKAKKVWITTFHRMCLEVLRKYGEHINLKRSFTIVDPDAQVQLIKQILSEMDPVDVKPRQLAQVIDRAKNLYIGPYDLEAEGGTFVIPEHIDAKVAVEVYKNYHFALRQRNAIDMNDIINRTVRLFQEVPEALSRVQDRAVFTMIDEYQDTNTSQHLLTTLLCSRDRNLMCIGDPDQSIYRWRGADVNNILSFREQYPECQTYRLEWNYRSQKPILDLANTLIRHNVKRFEKSLQATREGQNPILHLHLEDHNEEALKVAGLVLEKVAAGAELQDIAVLYRNNQVSRAIETALRKHNIPCRISGGVSFYQRKEIKDMLAYLLLAVVPEDDLSLLRIINTPVRGIGKTSVEKLERHARDAGVSLFRALEDSPSLLSRGAEKVMEFWRFLLSLQEAATRKDLPELLAFIRKGSGYDDHLADEEDGAERLENLNEFTLQAREWQRKNGGELHDFLSDITLLSGDEETGGQAVNLMTMHTAKGLEFKHVIVAALNDHILPSERTLKDLSEEGLEEERRLFYVAVTRAMDSLTLLSASERFVNGEVSRFEPSMFLQEIEDHLSTPELSAFPDGSNPA